MAIPDPASVANQAIPYFIGHTVLRRERVSRQRLIVSAGGELLGRVMHQVYVRSALLQPRSDGQHRHLLQILVTNRPEVEPGLAEMKRGAFGLLFWRTVPVSVLVHVEKKICQAKTGICR